MRLLAAVVLDTWRSLRVRAWSNLAVVFVLALGLTAVVSISSIGQLVANPGTGAIPSEHLYVFGTGREGAVNLTISGAEAAELRRSIDSLADAALIRWNDFNISAIDAKTGERAERVSGLLVDGDPFRLLNWPMALGRGFSKADFAVGAAPVVVIGDLLWRARFAADPSVVGREIRVDGKPATVVGVLPPNRAYTFQQQLYLAHALAGDSVHASRAWQSLLRADTPAQVQALNAALAAHQQERERTLGDTALESPLRMASIASGGPSAENWLLLLVLGVVVGLVMLMAASNAGGLLLVQWLGRSRELATRQALGASTRRVLSSLLAHALVLVATSWLLALLLSQQILAAFTRYLWRVESGMPLYVEFEISTFVLLTSAAAAVLAVVLIGLPVWWRLRRGGMAIELRSGARTTSGLLSRFGRGVFGLQALLAVVTVMATLQAALGAIEQQHRPLGINTDSVLVAEFDGSDPAAKTAFATQLRERLAAEPGVSAVSVGAHIPQALSSGRDLIRGENRISADYAPVDVGFAEVYQLPLRSGRWFSAAEVTQSRRVAVIDPALAAALFADSDPIGQTFEIEQRVDALVYEVIGVTETVRLSNVGGVDQPSLFVPLAAAPVYGLAIAVRVQGSPNAAIPRLLAIAAQINPDIGLTHVGSYAERRVQAKQWTLMVLGLFAPLGALALVLAATGLAALLGGLINDRIREIGLMRALGATPARVVRALLGGLARWGAIGALLGAACAVALIAPLGQSLYGENQIGPAVITVTFAALLAVFALAVSGPLRRALRITPIQALRHD